MIILDDVSKSFGSHLVLKKVSLKFPGGQTHVLLGSSGCGKSTLLRLMMGLTLPDSGEIFIADQKVSPQSQREMAKKIGYVIQDGGLFPHLTVAKNVSLVARTLGWEKERISERLTRLLGLVELEANLLNHYPRQLSGGQRQRVSLMRALMLDPAILLLDEPLGALDPVVRGTLQGQLKNIFNSVKKTVVIVTHDIGEAAFFGHTVTLMDDGKIVQHGEFEDLVARPASTFVSDFINAQRPPPQLKMLL